MTMTNEEIARDYRLAKSKRKQIGILAEINECDKRKICEILTEAGEKLPGNFGPRQTAPKPAAVPKPSVEPVDTYNTCPDEFDGFLRQMVRSTAESAIVKLAGLANDGCFLEYVRGILVFLDEFEYQIKEARNDDLRN